MTLITSMLMFGRKKTGVSQAVFQPAFDVAIGDIRGIKKANPRYVDLSFLAAHDANTGRAEHGAPLEKCASNILFSTEPLIRNYLYRYVKTQTTTIYEMLRYGCRFIHIKVTYYDGKWFTSHSVLTGELETHMSDVLRFLSERENDGEIVTLLFQPIFFGDKSFADLHDFLAGIRYNGKNIFDYVFYSPVDEFGKGEGVKVGALRYNDATGPKGRTGVVLFQRRDQHYLPSWDARQSAYPFFFDMDSNALHVWHDRSRLKTLDREIDALCDEILATDRYKDMLRLNQTQPSSCYKTLGDALHSVYSRSLLKTAERHNVRLIEKLDLNKMLKAMPVFQADYVTSGHGDFNLKINRAIRAYNESLVASLL